jgi:Fe-S-cluster containining protein
LSVDAALVAAIQSAVAEDVPLVRTICACPADVAYCSQVPGQLIGSDVAAIAQHVDDVEDYLQASHGAEVTLGEQSWRVPTIRPRMVDGHCIFLDGDRCRIHAVAPFGCAYFDAHIDPQLGNKLAWWGVRQIVDDAEYLALHARLAARHGIVEPIIQSGGAECA